MKLVDLRLIAFGPFTDVRLDLSRGRDGLHFIHGPNEAGKSSTLRAIDQFLFKIDHRTSDAFVHDPSDLRIGGTLELATGERLEAIRRKGNKGTLREGDDKTLIAESDWQRFLGTMDRGLFQQMFGLGRETLIAGGQEILRGGGEVGQLLFSAGSGIANLRGVREQLRSEADTLFRPRGSRTINQSLQLAETLRREKAELESQSQAWIEKDAELSRVQEEIARRRAERTDARLAVSRWERQRDALPLVAKRRQLEAELESIGDVRFLDDDFRARLQDSLKERQIARREIESRRSMLVAVIAEREQLVDPSEWIDRAETIEELYQESGKVKKAAQDLPGLREKRRLLEGQVDDLCQQLGQARDLFDSATQLPSRPLQERLRRMSREREQRDAAIQDAEKELRRAEQRHSRIEEELASLGQEAATESVEQILEEMRKEGDPTALLAEIDRGIRVESEAIARLAARWPIPLADVPPTSPLAPEELEEWEERFRKCRQQREDLDLRQGELERERAALEEQLAALNAGDPPPTESDLLEARRLRDDAWKEIASGFSRDDASSDAWDRYPDLVRRADGIADRLRQEADGVAARANLTGRREAARQALANLGRKHRQIRREVDSLKRDWDAKWGVWGIRTGETWALKKLLQEVGDLRQRQTKERELQTRREEIAGRCEALSRRMRSALAELAKMEEVVSASRLFDQARDWVARQVSLRERRRRLHDDRAEALREWNQAEETRAALVDASTKAEPLWQESLCEAGLPRASHPNEVVVALDLFQQLGERLRERDGLRERIAGIEADARDFDKRVDALCEKLAVERSAEGGVERTLELYRRWKQAEKIAADRRRLDDARQSSEQELSTLEERAARADAVLQALCLEANVPAEGELPQAADRSDRAKERRAHLRLVDDQLTQLAGGEPLKQFLSLIETCAADQVERECDSAQQAVRSIDETLADLEHRRGVLETELRQIDGGGKVARLAEDLEGLMGSLQRDADRYMRLELACGLLDRTIERYRKENEGPLLHRASEFFRELTLGSFERLEVDFDPQGNEMLLGIRTGRGKGVGVSAMSEGTADQLYLAVRLASVELYASRHEPMPLILDDVLVNFDDDRSSATLRLLGDLSRTFQIIFLTHHRHLVELAEKSVTADRLFVHELPALTTDGARALAHRGTP